MAERIRRGQSRPESPYGTRTAAWAILAMSLVLLALWTVAGLIAAALALLAAASLGDREARVVAIGVIVLSLALLIAGVDGAA